MKWNLDDGWLYIFWAFIAGITLPIATTNNAILNTRSDFPKYQAFYTSWLGIALGGLAVLPIAYLSASQCKAPTQWWSISGGLWTLPAFGILIAAPNLGIQLTLLIGLVTQLSTTLLLDRLDGRYIFSSPTRLLAVGIVLFGVFLDHPNATASFISTSEHTRLLYVSSSTHHIVESPLMDQPMIRDVLLSAVAGLGYTLQSKCNNVLSKDVGSAAGATAVSAAVNFLASLPIIWFLTARLNKWPTFLLQDWLRFAFAAFQSAFYIGSLAIVPKFIGYTTAFVAVHCGSLVASLVCDATGTLGKFIPVSTSRAIAVVLVLVGVWLFSRAAAGDTACDIDDTIEAGDQERQALISKKGDAHLSLSVLPRADG